MPVLKPVRGIRLNKSHPLARGLVGYWLLNEGSGNKAFDLSGNGNDGHFVNTPIWASGRYGSTIDFVRTDSDYISTPYYPDPRKPTTLIYWGTFDDVTPSDPIGDCMGPHDGDNRFYLGIDHDGSYYCGIGDSYIGIGIGDVAHDLSSGEFVMLAVTTDGQTARVFKNGIEKTSFAYTASAASTMAFDIGRRNHVSSVLHHDGKIELVSLIERALSASEIALLYREPFRMFDRASNVARLSSLVAPQIVELAGTSTALSSLSALTKVSRKCGGTIAGTSNVDGSLGIMGAGIVELAGTIAGRSNVNGHLGLLAWTEGSWLTEALFNGMTANAFKLGLALSLGWFWVRVTGCSALYRGQSMGEIDFGGVANILAVSDRATSDEERETISPPSYIPHDGDPNGVSTYFYVVRRFNSCGYQELTLEAAVKVSISPGGELAEPQPNNIADSKIEQFRSNKIRLTWFYCPILEGSRPVKFNVYYDGRTGQIDYETPLFSSEYKGRRFYSFQSNDLGAGGGASEHLFVIRTEDADGIENISLARLKIQLDTLNPDAIDILRAEAI